MRAAGVVDIGLVWPQPGLSPLCMCYLHFPSCKTGRVTRRVFCEVLCIIYSRKMPSTFRGVLSPGCKTAHPAWRIGQGLLDLRSTDLDPFSDSRKAKYCPYPDTNNMVSSMLLFIFRYSDPAALCGFVAHEKMQLGRRNLGGLFNFLS